MLYRGTKAAYRAGRWIDDPCITCVCDWGLEQHQVGGQGTPHWESESPIKIWRMRESNPWRYTGEECLKPVQHPKLDTHGVFEWMNKEVREGRREGGDGARGYLQVLMGTLAFTLNDTGKCWRVVSRRVTCHLGFNRNTLVATEDTKAGEPSGNNQDVFSNK